jgi:hypothetical protein
MAETEIESEVGLSDEHLFEIGLCRIVSRTATSTASPEVIRPAVMMCVSTPATWRISCPNCNHGEERQACGLSPVHPEEMQFDSYPAPQPFQSGASPRQPRSLQAETLGLVDGMARSRGMSATMISVVLRHTSADDC